jgi:hypothetical protein
MEPMDIMYISMALGLIGMYLNALPTFKHKMISWEIWAVANIIWMIGGYLTGNIPLIIFNLGCLILTIYAISNHLILVDAERAWNTALLEIPPKD